MATTQTQHSVGWNASVQRNQGAGAHAWSVEYASLVVRRPAPVPLHAGTKPNFKLFRSKHASHAHTRTQIKSSLDEASLARDMQNGVELLSQRQQEVAARKREEETFKGIGATQVWKSQNAARQATAPRQRKQQAADAGEIMGRIASERKGTRNKRPRSDEGSVPHSNICSTPASLALPAQTQTQGTPASGPSTVHLTPKPSMPPAKKQSRQRRGATFVVD